VGYKEGIGGRVAMIDTDFHLNHVGYKAYSLLLQVLLERVFHLNHVGYKGKQGRDFIHGTTLSSEPCGI